MPAKRVLVCDDHSVVRAGLRLILEEQNDFELVGEAAEGGRAIEMAAALKPDIAIMDLSMPGLSGLEAIPQLLRVVPDIKILVLTAHDDENYFFQALRAGACGYVLKGATPGELVGALHVVAGGGVAVPRELGRQLLSDYVARGSGADLPSDETLTEREQEVLRLVAAGRSNKEIADSLYLSVRTVERHRTTIMSKLGLQGKAELMRYAMRRGMLDSYDA